MSVFSKAIIDEAASVLNDEAFTYWTSTFHLRSLNSGQLLISILKPDSSVTTDSYKMVTGTRQTLPTGTSAYQNPAAVTLPAGTKLVKVVMNTGTTGIVPGRAPALVDMDLLAATNPLWTMAAASAQAKQYMYDPRDPKVFWVSPPQPATNQGYLQVIYNSIPGKILSYAPAEAIALPDEYEAPLLYWLLFKAYSRDADSTHANAALQYYDAFLQSLHLTSQIKAAEDPNVKDAEASVSY